MTYTLRINFTQYSIKDYKINNIIEGKDDVIYYINSMWFLYILIKNNEKNI